MENRKVSEMKLAPLSMAEFDRKRGYGGVSSCAGESSLQGPGFGGTNPSRR